VTAAAGRGASEATELLRETRSIVERAVGERAFPGAVIAAGTRDGSAVGAFGHLTYDADASAVTPQTVYDLASLTKVLVTTTAAILLHGDGRLDLETPVSALVPSFSGVEREGVKVWHLLTHSSGLEWWAPLYRELSGPQAYVDRIARSPLGYAPGTRSVYSDFGFILLGAALEGLAGEPLEGFVTRRVFAPLGLEATRFCPPVEWRGRTAPTEVCAWRGRLVHGEVHDENAYAMGGIAPQAGLFGTAPDLARFARMVLGDGVWEGQRLLASQSLELFTRRAGIPGSTRALGWDTPNDHGYSTAGTLLSRTAFGHIGFTGTSLWIERERGLFCVLLTNRVHPSRHNESIRWVRPAVTDAFVRVALDR
jgi:CubicO group peptidase (beta-lactamase class C family)